MPLKEESDNIKRDTWATKAEFILTCIGYIVGLGNIWRFPYLCYKNGGETVDVKSVRSFEDYFVISWQVVYGGGNQSRYVSKDITPKPSTCGAFLVPYLITVMVVGFPLACMEFSMGQFSGMGMIEFWNISPLFKGLGITFGILNLLISIYFIFIPSLCLYYLADSFSSSLPWVGCHHEWNTDLCFDVVSSNISGDNGWNCEAISNISSQNVTRILPAEEYMINKVLNLSNSIDEIGSVHWKLFVFFIITWLLVYLVTIRGVKSFGKVVYFTSTVPYVLLTALVIRGLLLPGSLDGIMFYLIPRWEKLLDPQVWYSAAQQVFYSLGISLGCFITMSSYNNYSDNCIRDAAIATVVNCFTSMYGGLAIFSVLGFMALESCQSIDNVLQAGPEFAFIAYPRALATLPLPQVWSILFFAMLVVVGLSSQAVHFETLLICFTDRFTSLRKPLNRSLVGLIFCLIFMFIGTIFSTKGGMYIFTLVDWFAAPVVMIIAAILECIIMAWIYGSGKLSEHIRCMTGKSANLFLRICWRFTPIVLLTILGINMMSWKSVTYRNYTYSTAANLCGWMLTIAVILPIPVIAIYKITSHCKRFGIKNILKSLLAPTEDFQNQILKRRQTASTNHSSMEMKLLQ